ncbi:MAG: hypothetical protein EPO24_15685 [Bacteroidetes bacterium]|nr:MAG: hypothetical protein EPO24_15685 [Bacteroidota bacterium]
MNPLSQSVFRCEECNETVNEKDTFCANCGAMFLENQFCALHDTPVEGVCVICFKLCCRICGKKENGIFLCNEHWLYEIYEGMARIWGSTDNVQAQFVVNLLEQAGFHPFLYSMRFNPGADIVSINKIYLNYGEHPICELKVLVPFREVLKAEQVLKEADSAFEFL